MFYFTCNHGIILWCHVGSARCRGERDVSAARECRLERYLVQLNSRGRVTEQSVSRDDWETMVRYNEKILQKETLASSTDHLQPLDKIIPQRTRQPSPASWRIERPSFKPPKPPKPTSPQQTAKRLLPVQQFLNRQVYGKYSATSVSLSLLAY